MPIILGGWTCALSRKYFYSMFWQWKFELEVEFGRYFELVLAIVCLVYFENRTQLDVQLKTNTFLFH